VKPPASKQLKRTAGMAAFEIAYELRRRGFSQADVARRLRVQHGTVSNILHGRATSYRVASFLAAVIGRGVGEIWPGRYEFRPRKRIKRKGAILKPLR
jgi:Ner family transcriptional regulator